jgi:hypothetical protein
MSAIAGSHVPWGPAATGERRCALRVLVAIASETDAALALPELDVLRASNACSITLMSVVAPSLFVQCFAPTAGMLTAQQIREMWTAAAAELVGTKVAGRSWRQDLDDRRLASGWTAPELLRPLRLGVYDMLLLGRPPRGRYSRWRLLAAADASETSVVVAPPLEASPHPVASPTGTTPQ